MFECDRPEIPFCAYLPPTNSEYGKGLDAFFRKTSVKFFKKITFVSLWFDRRGENHKNNLSKKDEQVLSIDFHPKRFLFQSLVF